MTLRQNQKGSVLIISLVMLVLMTLIAVSAIQTTGNMLQIVGNAQFREEAVSAGQQAIDRLIGSITATEGIKTKATALNATNISVDLTGDNVGDYAVTFSPLPVCLSRSDAGTYVDNQIILERNIALNPVVDTTDVQVARREAARTRYRQLSTCKANKDLGNQCYWSLWRVTAAVSDTFTGASTVVTQGVRVLIGLDNKVNNCE